MENTETVLLAAIKNKDNAGLESLFNQFYRPLVMYAYQYLDRLDEAEDLVQDVFVKLWERDSLLLVESRLYAYLYTTVKNACINKLGGTKKINYQSLRGLDDMADEQPLDEDAWAVYIQQVKAEIDKLPPKTKHIFKAIVLDRRKYKDVALEMGVSTNTVKTSLARALYRLRIMFKDGYMTLFVFFCLCTRLLK